MNECTDFIQSLCKVFPDIESNFNGGESDSDEESNNKDDVDYDKEQENIK